MFETSEAFKTREERRSKRCGREPGSRTGWASAWNRSRTAERRERLELRERRVPRVLRAALRVPRSVRGAGAGGAVRARAAAQPQAGPPAGLPGPGQARAAVPGGRARRRVRPRATGEELLGDDAAADAVVLGYAETATGLGHSVADGLGLAPYLHSTRRPVPGVAQAGGFEEAHSHATSHLLLPEDPRLLAGSGPLVLVDDEFSTGNTVLNTIRDLHARHPRGHYVVVALVDMRSEADRGGSTRSPPSWEPGSTSWPWPPGPCDFPKGCWPRGRRWSRSTRRPRTPLLRASAGPPPPSGGSHWTGPPGCPTAAGTVSPPRTAPGWRPPCPPSPSGSPRPWTRPRTRIGARARFRARIGARARIGTRIGARARARSRSRGRARRPYGSSSSATRS